MSDQPTTPPSPAGASRRDLLAYAGPFVLFILLQAVPGLVRTASPTAPWFLQTPEFWIYPLQTLLCGGLMFYFRREYPRGISPLGALVGAGAGAIVFALWISPQAFLHFAPRLDGFDPSRLLAADGQPTLAYQATVTLRFARLVLVVPWLEEIFWRAFLLRYLIKEDFTVLPFGAWSPLSFAATTLGFMLEHSRPDWPAALATGVIYNLVAIRTRSLSACVLAHALTNALLGGYVMHTHQWGFW